MKKLTVLFLTWMVSLSALKVEIPLDEQLMTFSLKRGIEVWLRQHACNPSLIACRFISHDRFQGKPRIYDFDCPTPIFESEFPSFLEYCEEEIQKQGGVPIGLVAVGSIDVQGLKHFLVERYHEQSAQEEVSYESIQIFPADENSALELCLSYKAALSPIQTAQDVKKLWTFYLVQSMAETRFKEAVIVANGEWVGESETRYFLPAITTIGYGIERDFNSSMQSRLLTGFLQAMQTLKERGFTENELAEAKSKLQRHLRQLYQINPDSIILADYYASYLGARLHCPDYSVFMTLSSHVISEIGMNDIAEVLRDSFKDETRSVAVRFPDSSSLNRDSIQKTLNSYSSDSIIYQEPVKMAIANEKNAFLKLPVTEEEQRRLRRVIQVVANTNPISLGFKISELSREEAALAHIHPLRALAVFMTDPYTKQCLVKIMKNYFKGSSFIGKTAERLKQEDNKNNLLPYISGFCQAVRANPDQVRLYIQKKDYEGLIKYLIKLKN